MTITCGTNTLAGTKKEKIREVVRQQRDRAATGRVPEKWDGKAGARIVEAIAAEVARKSPEPALR